jgi:Asp-tRNA(Asn)/Glu-tRNA(Gln) amidotransferase A subunit family amidase
MFGVPISIKDNIFLKDTRASVGCAFLLDDIAKEHAVGVELLLRAGAIPLVKGNCP